MYFRPVQYCKFVNAVMTDFIATEMMIITQQFITDFIQSWKSSERPTRSFLYLDFCLTCLCYEY